MPQSRELRPPAWPLRPLWRPLYHRLVARRWGRVLWRTWQASQLDELPLVSASIAYYALFSFFPILLFFVIAAPSWMGADPDRLVDLLALYVPGELQVQFLGELLRNTLEQRGTTGGLALLALLWSGSGVFAALSRGINRVWGRGAPQSFWRVRLLGVALALVLGLLLLLSLAATAVLNLIEHLPVLGSVPGTGRLAILLVSLGVNFLMFLLLYAVVPSPPVPPRWAIPGALAATVTWELAKAGLALYLSSFARFSLVYGSLGAIMVFLLWAYLSAQITLLGAELCAAYAQEFHGYRPSPAADSSSEGG